MRRAGGTSWFGWHGQNWQGTGSDGTKRHRKPPKDNTCRLHESLPPETSCSQAAGSVFPGTCRHKPVMVLWECWSERVGLGQTPSRAPAIVQNALRAPRITRCGGRVCRKDQLNPGASGVGLPHQNEHGGMSHLGFPGALGTLLAHGERMRRGRGAIEHPTLRQGAPERRWLQPSLQGTGKRSPPGCLLGFPSRVRCWMWGFVTGSIPGTVGMRVPDPWCLASSETSDSHSFWSDPLFVTESRAAPWPCPRAHPHPGSDILEGCPPSPVPLCSLEPCSPCAKAGQSWLKEKMVQTPVGFWWELIQTPLSTEHFTGVSQPCLVPFRVSRVSKAAGALCHGAEQTGALPAVAFPCLARIKPCSEESGATSLSAV